METIRPEEVHSAILHHDAVQQEDAARRILETLQAKDMQIEELTRTAAHLRREVAIADTETRRVRDEKEQVMVQFQYALRDCERRDEELHEADMKVATATKALEAVTGELDAVRKTALDLDSSCKSREDEASELRDLLTAARDDIHDLEKKLAVSEEESKHAKSQVGRLDSDLRDALEELSKLQKAAESHAEDAQGTVQVFRRRLEVAEQKISGQTSEIDRLEKVSKKVDPLQETLGSVKEDLAIERVKCAELSALVEQQEETIGALRNGVTAYRSAEDAYEEKLGQMSDSSRELTAQLDEYRKANADFELALKVKLAEIEELQGQLEERGVEVEKLRGDVQNSTTGNTILQHQVNDLSQRVKKREQWNQQLSEHSNEIRAHVEELESHNERLAEELQSVKSELSLCIEEREALSLKVEGNTAALADNQRRFSEAAEIQANRVESLTSRIRDLEDVEAENSRLLAEIERLVQDREEARGEIAVLVDQVQTLETQLGTTRGALQDQRAATEAAREETTEQLRSLRAAEQEKADALLRNEKLQVQLSSKANAVESLRRSAKENKEVADTIPAWQARCDALQAKLAEAEDRVRMGKIALANARRVPTNDSHVAENASLTARVEELEKALREEKQRGSKTSERCRAYQEKVTHSQKQVAEVQELQQATAEELKKVRSANKRQTELHHETMNRIASDIVRALLDNIGRSKAAGELVSQLRHGLLSLRDRYLHVCRVANERQHRVIADQPAMDERNLRLGQLEGQVHRDDRLLEECDSLSRALGVPGYSQLLNSSRNALVSANVSMAESESIQPEDGVDLRSIDRLVIRREGRSAKHTTTSLLEDEIQLGQAVLGALGAPGAPSNAASLRALLQDAFDFWFERCEA